MSFFFLPCLTILEFFFLLTFSFLIISDRLSNLPDPTSSLPLSPSAVEPESKVAEHPLEFGNAVYKIKFDSKDSTPRFGHRYTFFLQDAVEEVPEWVVYWDLFVE